MASCIGYIAGVVDTSDPGDMNMLRHARERCSRLIVGVPAKTLLRSPADPAAAPVADRCERLRALPYVDDVYIETDASPLSAWRDVHFTHLFLGEQWRGSEYGMQLAHQLATFGVKVCFVSRSEHRFSTALWRALDDVADNALAVVG